MLLICSIQMLSQYTLSIVFNFVLFSILFCCLHFVRLLACYSSSRFVPLIFFIAFFRNILESHSLNGRTLLKVAGRLTICLFVSRFVPLLFFHFIRFSFSSMPRKIHSPLIPPAHSASRMRKELSPLHYPCYPIIYKKHIFA